MIFGQAQRPPKVSFYRLRLGQALYMVAGERARDGDPYELLMDEVRDLYRRPICAIAELERLWRLACAANRMLSQRPAESRSPGAAR